MLAPAGAGSGGPQLAYSNDDKGATVTSHSTFTTSQIRHTIQRSPTTNNKYDEWMAAGVRGQASASFAYMILMYICSALIEQLHLYVRVAWRHPHDDHALDL